MRVVTATPARRWRFPVPPRRSARAARIERLGLAAASLVAGLGLLLAWSGQRATTTPCRQDGGCVNLTTLRDPQAVLPLLTMFDEQAERLAVARAITARAVNGQAPAIAHVGALASVTIAADGVRAQPGLVRLNERLRARPTLREVPVLSAADLSALKPSLIVRTEREYTTAIAGLAALFLLSFWLAHLVRWWFGTTGDGVLLPAVHLLTTLGLMTMIALRDPMRDTIIATSFVEGVAAGCIIWTLVSFIDFERPRLRRAVLLPLGAAVALAVALLLAGSGPAGSGARVNLFGVQPVEAIRLLVVFALAAYFARRWQFLREFSEDLASSPRVQRRVRLPRWKDVRPLAITLATLLLFFFLQKDLGPALVLSCVFLGLYGLARGRAALVVTGFAVLALGFSIGYALGIPDTVARRVAMWLDPWGNGLSGGDQIAHALWAMATGGSLGLGAGMGDPQLIPAGHTDLVLAAAGEELGMVGVLCALLLLGLLAWRMLRIALRAPGDYTAFLGAGLVLALTAQALVIVGGLLGLLPLAGVVTPFMSFGRSSMLSNFTAVAICAAIARRQGPAREPFTRPVAVLQWTLATACLVVVARVVVVQLFQADDVAVEANLTRQGDGGYRYQYNPRLVAAAGMIPRGTIYDRTGMPLATSDRRQLEPFAAHYRRLGLTGICGEPDARCYPLGGLAFHLLGDAQRQINWAATNTSFVEQEHDAHLRGFDDQARTVTVTHPQTGASILAVRRDYRQLLPMARHRHDPEHDDVKRILGRNRDLQLTVDAGLQVATARAVRRQALAAGSGRAAAIAVDPRTGELLASASYPWPDDRALKGQVTPEAAHLLDRARYGLYAPGSTFKLVTAAAALRDSGPEPAFHCVRLPDGRVGGHVPGVGRPIRDDLQDTVPHGHLDLHRALAVSCNAYFANLAQTLGATALSDTAAAAQIAVAPAPVESNLRQSLPYAGYGQGDVVATPLRMARVAAALASDGVLRDVVVTKRPAKTSPAGAAATPGTTWLDPAGAAALRRDMRAVVTSGTGRSLASHAVPIAGKTGTAEVDGRRSHAWFVGFAPYGAPRVAFATIVENAGYGGRIAAPLAGELVSAAAARGLLQEKPKQTGRTPADME